MGQPWDRQPDESSTQYTQFLVYRNHGPSRSLALAYRHYLQLFESELGATKGPSGAYKEAAVRFRWADRAQAWDHWRLETYGRRVAPLYTAALEAVARKLARAARRHKPGDAEWRDVLDTLDRVYAQLEPAYRAAPPADTPDTPPPTDAHAQTPLPDEPAADPEADAVR